MSLLRKYLNYLRHRRDPKARFDLLRQVGASVFPEYRFKWPQLDWWRDPRFDAYLERFDETGGMNTDRRFALCQLLRLVDDVAGDTAECGVYAGCSSYLICRANLTAAAGPRVHHLFDSFEGLSGRSERDGTHWDVGDLRCELETLRRNLAEFDALELHPGWIPARFPDVLSRTFAFVHIDVDLHQPTHDSVAFFYPRLAPGGILVCDDYGFGTCPGATSAVDEFLADKPEKMVSLSAGGGFLIKGCKTGAPAVGGV